MMASSNTYLTVGYIDPLRVFPSPLIPVYAKRPVVEGADDGAFIAINNQNNVIDRFEEYRGDFVRHNSKIVRGEGDGSVFAYSFNGLDVFHFRDADEYEGFLRDAMSAGRFDDEPFAGISAARAISDSDAEGRFASDAAVLVARTDAVMAHYWITNGVLSESARYVARNALETFKEAMGPSDEVPSDTYVVSAFFGPTFLPPPVRGVKIAVANVLDLLATRRVVPAGIFLNEQDLFAINQDPALLRAMREWRDSGVRITAILPFHLGPDLLSTLQETIHQVLRTGWTSQTVEGGKNEWLAYTIAGLIRAS